MTSQKLKRCSWAEQPLEMQYYHDTEWGVPLRSDRRLFEFLILEGMQAGLSWLTVLRKRENYRKAFDRFDPKKIANYKQTKIRSLLRNEGIIRNQLKVESAVTNAQSFLAIQKEFGSFHRFLWDMIGGRPIQNAWQRLGQIPATSNESDQMSYLLKAHGFRFVGSTICYAHMQATGMVNDHLTYCFRYSKIKQLAQKFERNNS